QAEDGIRDFHVTGVQTCALPIWSVPGPRAVCARSTGGLCPVHGGLRPVHGGLRPVHGRSTGGLRAVYGRVRKRSRASTTNWWSRSEERRVGQEGRAGWSTYRHDW